MRTSTSAIMRRRRSGFGEGVEQSWRSDPRLPIHLTYPYSAVFDPSGGVECIEGTPRVPTPIDRPSSAVRVKGEEPKASLEAAWARRHAHPA